MSASGHAALTSVEEGNEGFSDAASAAKPSLQLEEAVFRSKLKRDATSSLIASLHSLKPVATTDTRLIDIAILNEVRLPPYITVSLPFHH